VKKEKAEEFVFLPSERREGGRERKRRRRGGGGKLWGNAGKGRGKK
jgi:hypothetical protein